MDTVHKNSCFLVQTIKTILIFRSCRTRIRIFMFDRISYWAENPTILAQAGSRTLLRCSWSKPLVVYTELK